MSNDLPALLKFHISIPAPIHSFSLMIKGIYNFKIKVNFKIIYG